MSDIKYTSAKDYKTLFLAAAMGYAPYLSLMGLIAGGPAVLRNMLTIACVAVALNIPYLREIPLALTRFVIMPLIARKKTEPSERLKQIFNRVAARADAKGLKLYVYEKGVTTNAFMFSDDVAVGKNLGDNMDDEKIEGVIAHEVSHYKAGDMTVGYVTSLPWLNAFILNFAAWATAATEVTRRWPSLEETAVMGTFLTMTYGYLQYQRVASGIASRVMEYRADRNAVQITENPAGMIKALAWLEAQQGRPLKLSFPAERGTDGAPEAVRAGRDVRDYVSSGDYAASRTLWQRFRALATSHPSTIERIAAIATRAGLEVRIDVDAPMEENRKSGPSRMDTEPPPAPAV